MDPMKQINRRPLPFPREGKAGLRTSRRWNMSSRTLLRFLLAAVISGTASGAAADTTKTPATPADRAPVQAQRLAPDQLADLVAPIALYPDPLLSQVLVASTYPLEVVEARQWLRRNGNLKGESLMAAAREQDWDASVQALVAFPDVLDTLGGDVGWTEALGNAFLAQEADVMAAVQRLRRQAETSGRLSSTPQQTVSAGMRDGQSVVEIEPADPQVIYVPQYDPVYVWGPPAWGAYPDLAYGDGFGFGPAIDVGFWFGGWGGWAGWAGWGSWGWCPNWWGGVVVVNNPWFDHCGFRGGHGGGGHGGHGAGHGGQEPWHHDPGRHMGSPSWNGRFASRSPSVSVANRTAAPARADWRNAAPRTLGSGSRPAAQDWRSAATRTSAVTRRSASVSGDSWRRISSARRGDSPVRSWSAPSRSYSSPAARWQSAPRRSPTGFAARPSGGGAVVHGSGGSVGARGFGGGVSHGFGGGSHGFAGAGASHGFGGGGHAGGGRR